VKKERSSRVDRRGEEKRDRRVADVKSRREGHPRVGRPHFEQYSTQKEKNPEDLRESRAGASALEKRNAFFPPPPRGRRMAREEGGRRPSFLSLYMGKGESVHNVCFQGKKGQEKRNAIASFLSRASAGKGAPPLHHGRGKKRGQSGRAVALSGVSVGGKGRMDSRTE